MAKVLEISVLRPLFHELPNPTGKRFALELEVAQLGFGACSL
jgi:hypothetical protein